MEQPAARLGSETAWWGPESMSGGFRHEVHAAEEDELCVGAVFCLLGQLEGVADEVGVAHDFIALVEVAHDDESLAKRSLGCADAEVKLGCGGLAILLGEDALQGHFCRDYVSLGGAGAVAGGGIEDPGRGGEDGGTGGLLGVDLDQVFYRVHVMLLRLCSPGCLIGWVGRVRHP